MESGRLKVIKCENERFFFDIAEEYQLHQKNNNIETEMNNPIERSGLLTRKNNL